MVKSFSKEKQEHIESYGGKALFFSSHISHSISERLKSWDIVLNQDQTSTLIADIYDLVKLYESTRR